MTRTDHEGVGVASDGGSWPFSPHLVPLFAFDIRSGKRVGMTSLLLNNLSDGRRTRAMAPLVAVLVFASSLLGSPAGADSSPALSRARLQLDAVTAQIRTAQKERDALKAQIGGLLAQIGGNQRALDRQHAQIEATRTAVVALSEQVDAQQAALDARAAEVYEQGSAGALALLLDATSFDNFEARLQYVGSVARSDQDLMAQLTDRKTELEARGTTLSANVAALEATKTRLEQEASALDSTLARQLDTNRRLNQEQATAQALVNELNRRAQPPSPRPAPSPIPPRPSPGQSVQDLITRYFTPLGVGTVQQVPVSADAADPGRGHARGSDRIRPHRDPAIRQAAVHLVSAPIAGIRMGGAGGGEGVAGPRSPPMTSFCATAAISHSPNARKPANLPEIASIMPLP